MLINKNHNQLEFAFKLIHFYRLQSPVNTPGLYYDISPNLFWHQLFKLGAAIPGDQYYFSRHNFFSCGKGFALVINYIKKLSIGPFFNYEEKTPQFYRCLFYELKV